MLSLSGIKRYHSLFSTDHTFRTREVSPDRFSWSFTLSTNPSFRASLSRTRMRFLRKVWTKLTKYSTALACCTPFVIRILSTQARISFLFQCLSRSFLSFHQQAAWHSCDLLQKSGKLLLGIHTYHIGVFGALLAFRW